MFYSWKFFPDSTRSHWLLWGHMTSNNRTSSRQNLWEGNNAKSVTLEGNRALLPVNADQYAALLWHKLKYSSLYITCNTIYESPLWNFPCCFGSTFTGLKNCRRMLNKRMVIITSTSHNLCPWLGAQVQLNAINMDTSTEGGIKRGLY